ncbi:TPA: hypothetical protein ACN30N_004162 [Vibrio campbellii]
MADSIRNQLLSKGWGRHSCILIEPSVSEWLSPLLSDNVRHLCVDNNIIIISTYDCAVINDCFDSEPWVNVLIARPLESLSGDCLNGRNERKLHFNIDIDGEDKPFEVSASGIFQFERQYLLELNKLENYTIEEHASLSLKNWLAERFRKDVWPDAFNESIKSARNRLKSYYKRRNEFVSGVYINLDSWEEKAKEDKYVIKAIIAVEDGKLRGLRKSIKDNQKQLKLTDTSNEAIDIYLKCELKDILGDKVEWILDETQPKKVGVAIELKTESNFTLSHVRCYRRLNPYSMSDESDSAPMPAEMEGAA